MHVAGKQTNNRLPLSSQLSPLQTRHKYHPFSAFHLLLILPLLSLSVIFRFSLGNGFYIVGHFLGGCRHDFRYIATHLFFIAVTPPYWELILTSFSSWGLLEMQCIPSSSTCSIGPEYLVWAVCLRKEIDRKWLSVGLPAAFYFLAVGWLRYPLRKYETLHRWGRVVCLGCRSPSQASRCRLCSLVGGLKR